MSRIEKNGFELEQLIMKCLKCNDTIESKHVHDFVTCKCTNLSIDGGPFEGARVLSKSDKYVDISLWREILVKRNLNRNIVTSQ